jgi:hypothetical protein
MTNESRCQEDPNTSNDLTTAIVPATKRKQWSKWLKFSGAALLLSAFGMQTQQNRQAALALERMQAAELDSRTLQKAISYEGLYYSAKATGFDNAWYLKMAAKQYFTGASAMMATSPIDRAEAQRDIDQLLHAAANVHDVESFREYAMLDNAFELKNHKTEMAGLIEPDRNAKSLGTIYLILYIIGSVVALFGQVLD